LAHGHYHTLERAQDITVRESHNQIAAQGEPSFPRLIAPTLRRKIMCPAIDLNDQTGGVTDKIGNELPHRHLPAKGEIIDMMRLEIAPQQSFRLRHRSPEAARSSPLPFAHLHVRHC